ncbi:hypothetical protein DL93DRAFT_2082284 [Clavulina sp. PMI_390]|nr:hypothetical protein DL93DRAFT_2082284 [Clavulina sp. PMI_390]
MTDYKLDYGAAIQSTGPVSTPDTNYLSPRLLPGGRWIISGVRNEDTASTYVFCWDRHAPSNLGDLPLRPVATFVWQDRRPLIVKRDWMQAQLEGSNEVTLAFSLWHPEYVSLIS